MVNKKRKGRRKKGTVTGQDHRMRRTRCENVAMESYIEVIDEIEAVKGKALTGDIARRLDINPASVTQMLAKLKAGGLISHYPYKGVRLTQKGRKMARELKVAHEAIAALLELVGVDPDTADKDACAIEHHITRKTMDRLRAFMTKVRVEDMEKLERMGRG